jgi:hypothetical protein
VIPAACIEPPQGFIRAASSKAPNDIASELLESLSCRPMHHRRDQRIESFESVKF